MRYLLLIPAVVAMLAAVMFYVALAHFRWGKWRTCVLLLAALSFQAAGLWIASWVDR